MKIPSEPVHSADPSSTQGPDRTEELLVERAQAGDATAFQALVDRHGRRLFRVAYRITGDTQAAEDAVQETFLSAYRRLDRFDGRARFSTWLHRIAVNAAIDGLRRQRRMRSWHDELADEDASLPSPEPGPDRHAHSAEIGRATRAALDGLSPMERTAFVLRHFEGRSIAEISRVLGIRENAGKQAVFRAVLKLRKALTPFVLPMGETP